MLQVQSLVAGYGALTVLHDVSLSVGDREAVSDPIAAPNKHLSDELAARCPTMSCTVPNGRS